jgi:hypothetical protein
MKILTPPHFIIEQNTHLGSLLTSLPSLGPLEAREKCEWGAFVLGNKLGAKKIFFSNVLILIYLDCALLGVII